MLHYRQPSFDVVAPRLRTNSSMEVLSRSNRMWQVFISNILQFQFPNILTLLCVAIVTNLTAFSLMNYVSRIGL